LETILRHINFKPLVFGSIGEMSSNVVAMVETAVEYGVEHLGRNIATATVDKVRTTLRRRYMTQLWRGLWTSFSLT
jgi:hypothetical protein